VDKVLSTRPFLEEKLMPNWERVERQAKRNGRRHGSRGFFKNIRKGGKSLKHSNNPPKSCSSPFRLKFLNILAWKLIKGATN
jgi:hypothetical protein